MFEVTAKAEEKLSEFFKTRSEKPFIRIFLQQGGWSGPALGMALDESNESDETFKINGLTFMIEKELFEMVKPVKIDFAETPRGSGYIIESGLKADGCGSCSGSCD